MKEDIKNIDYLIQENSKAVENLIEITKELKEMLKSYE